MGHRVEQSLVGTRKKLLNGRPDETDGFTARLSVTLPVNCAPDVVEQHLEHFAVEFRTWILRAASETNGAGATTP